MKEQEELSIPKLMYGLLDKKPKKVINHISPSSLGRCMRVHYWAIKGVDQTTPPNPGALLNFEVGFLWEEVVGKSLKAGSVPHLEQYHMYDEELNLEGTLDFAPIVDPKTCEIEVWDSKTEGMMAEKYRQREGHSFFQHHPEYVIQLTTYALLLKRQGWNVKKGKFGIIIKDNGLVTEESVVFTDELYLKVTNRITRLNHYLSTDTLPPCECEGWQVGYCNFGDIGTISANSKGKLINTSCCSEGIEKARKS